MIYCSRFILAVVLRTRVVEFEVVFLEVGMAKVALSHVRAAVLRCKLFLVVIYLSIYVNYDIVSLSVRHRVSMVS